MDQRAGDTLTWGKEDAMSEAVSKKRQRVRDEMAQRLRDEADAPFIEEELSLQALETSSAGARARSKRIARTGIGKLRLNQEITQKKKDAVQYRACRALLWEREQILIETGWTLQWFMSIEKYVNDEDRRIWSETDARNLFGTYREQQLQVARELEDLGEIFRGSRQYSALVSSLRTRADVLDRIVKTGQELGVIHKTAKQVEVTAQVDITQLSVVELRAHVQAQVAEVKELLIPVGIPEDSAASAVMKRLQEKFDHPNGKPDATAEAEVEVLETLEPQPRKTHRMPRVKTAAE